MSSITSVPLALLGKLNEDVFGSSNCLWRRDPHRNTREDHLTCRERYADFLGCRKEPGTVELMTVAHVTQAVYAITNEAVAVAMPFINGSVGGSVETFARMQSMSAGLQLCGGMVFGALADKYGPRTALLTAHASAFSSAVLAASAQSPYSLLLSMVPSVLTHGFQAAAQVTVQCSTQATRAVAMGRIGMTYGVGFFGGTLLTSLAATRLSARNIAWVAAGLEAGILNLVLLAYPADADKASTSSQSAIPSFSETWELVRHSRVAPLILLKVALSTSGGMIFCMLQQFAMDPFGLSVSQTSLMMAYVGGMHLLSQGFVVPWLGGLSPRALRAGTAVCLGLPLLGLACSATSPLAYVFWVGPLTTALHSAGTALNSMLSCQLPHDKSGIALALGMAPMTLGFLVSPLLSSWVFHHYGFRMVPVVAGGYLLVMVAAIEAWDNTAQMQQELQEQRFS